MIVEDEYYPANMRGSGPAPKRISLTQTFSHDGR